MFEVGQKVWCNEGIIKLFSKAPSCGDVLKVVKVSDCGTYLKVGGYSNWFKSEDFSPFLEVPKDLSEMKSALDATLKGWEYCYQKHGAKHMTCAFGLLNTYVSALSEEVKALQEEIKELKEKMYD